MNARSWPDPVRELGPRPTVIDYLFEDAATVEAQLDDCQLLVDDGAFDFVRRRFAALAQRLERHMRLEERVVLPQIARPLPAIPREHARLRRLVATTQSLLDERPTCGGDALARLAKALHRHERSEHRLLARYRSRI